MSLASFMTVTMTELKSLLITVKHFCEMGEYNNREAGYTLSHYYIAHTNTVLNALAVMPFS